MTTTPLNINVNAVFWLSWFVVYSVMVTFIALLVSLVSKFVIIKSISFGTIFLICEIFGFTLIMFAFMVTALFSKRKAAGAFGGIITMLMALSYYLQVSVRRKRGPDSIGKNPLNQKEMSILTCGDNVINRNVHLMI